MIKTRLTLAQRWWLMRCQARRRKGSFSPKNVPGLKLWVRAESLGLADGGPVATWLDESGNGANLVQAVGASKPTYRANVEGLPAVSFDGADDVVATVGNVLVTDRHTIFLVAKALASGGNDAVGTGNTGDGDLLLMAYGGVMRGHAWRSGNANATDGSTLIHDGAFAIFEQEVNATDLVLRLSGVQEASQGMAGAVNSASKPIYLGSRSAGWFFQGYVRALLVYQGNPSTVDKNAIRSYLLERYAVPTPYPSALSAPVVDTDWTAYPNDAYHVAVEGLAGTAPSPAVGLRIELSADGGGFALWQVIATPDLQIAGPFGSPAHTVWRAAWCDALGAILSPYSDEVIVDF
jgi:hypothetical protein